MWNYSSTVTLPWRGAQAENKQSNLTNYWPYRIGMLLTQPERPCVRNWGATAVDISGSLLAGRDQKTMHTECAKMGDRSGVELTLPDNRMKERPRTQ